MESTMSAMHSRERLLIGGALALLSLLCWGYLVAHGLHLDMITSMPVPAAGRGLEMLAMSALMWAVMMVAMMLPSASPMILTYETVRRRRVATGGTAEPTALFVAGYLAVWISFAVLAALAQWGLHQGGLLSSAMGKVDPLVGGGLLVAAGAFQFSELKQACLSKCRTPLSFLLTEWREDRSGVLLMGIRHGAYCTACCWALMLLMFVGGVMNLLWMAALAVYALAEKIVPGGRLFSRISGALLILGGTGVLVTELLAKATW